MVRAADAPPGALFVLDGSQRESGLRGSSLSRIASQRTAVLARALERRAGRVRDPTSRSRACGPLRARERSRESHETIGA